MPTGLKQSSSVVSIGFAVTETAPNTFTQGSVDLNLSPLDREVFVVLAVNLDTSRPDAIAGTNTEVRAGLTTTSQTQMPGLEDANCLARISTSIRAQDLRTVVSDSVPKHLKPHLQPSNILESSPLTTSSCNVLVLTILYQTVFQASCTVIEPLHLLISMLHLFNLKFSPLEGIKW